jgi:hypothetical protein
VIEKCDVADEASVKALISTVQKQHPPLKGVYHAAGYLQDTMLTDLGADGISKVIAPKITGTLNLHKATQKAKIEQFVLFSSVASMLGNVGQASYSAGNAFLDAFAEFRRGQGLPALSVQWGPWGEVGMAVRSAGLKETTFAKLDPKGAVTAFASLRKESSSRRRCARQVEVVPQRDARHSACASRVREALPQRGGDSFGGRVEPRGSGKQGEDVARGCSRLG